MSIIFQLVLFVLVLWSFVMIVGVPVAYASPTSQSKQLILAGSIIWGALVVIVGGLNYLVV